MPEDKSGDPSELARMCAEAIAMLEARERQEMASFVQLTRQVAAGMSTGRGVLTMVQLALLDLAEVVEIAEGLQCPTGGAAADVIRRATRRGGSMG